MESDDPDLDAGDNFNPPEKSDPNKDIHHDDPCLADPVSLGYDMPLEIAAAWVGESVSTVRRLTERGALASTGSGADERWFTPSLDDLVSYKEEKATYERRGHRNKLKKLLDGPRGRKYELVLWQAERERTESPE